MALHREGRWWWFHTRTRTPTPINAPLLGWVASTPQPPAGRAATEGRGESVLRGQRAAAHEQTDRQTNKQTAGGNQIRSKKGIMVQLRGRAAGLWVVVFFVCCRGEGLGGRGAQTWGHWGHPPHGERSAGGGAGHAWRGIRCAGRQIGGTSASMLSGWLDWFRGMGGVGWACVAVRRARRGLNERRRVGMRSGHAWGTGEKGDRQEGRAKRAHGKKERDLRGREGRGGGGARPSQLGRAGRLQV